MAYCARCGREVPLPEGYGKTFLCEFFYCKDRDDCDKFRAAKEADFKDRKADNPKV